MSRMPEPLILSVRGRTPQLHAESWVAPSANVIGQVSIAARASVWYGATLRAEAEPIDIGFGTNIQDGVTIHVDSEFPVSVGAGVSVGHNAGLVPPRSLVTGVPGAVRRELSDAEIANNRHNAAVYQHLVDLHRAALG
ncbi:MAG: gamma carbonic anhydrase family protein [Mycobacterium sp.]